MPSTFVWKVVVIGNPSVGKTTLMLQFTEKKFNELYIPTIGVQVSVKEIPVTYKGYTKTAGFNIWDIAGQQKFSNVRRLFYEGADAVIIVFDITEKQSFVNTSNWYKDYISLENKNFGVLIGNKVDLEKKRTILPDWGHTLSDKMGFRYFETSAKTGKNVEEIFSYLATNILQRNK